VRVRRCKQGKYTKKIEEGKERDNTILPEKEVPHDTLTGLKTTVYGLL
jgi:hypothetical protein